jgi:hypothetical protein
MTAMAVGPAFCDQGRFILSADQLVSCCRRCGLAAPVSTSGYENADRTTTMPPFL